MHEMMLIQNRQKPGKSICPENFEQIKKYFRLLEAYMEQVYVHTNSIIFKKG